VSYPGDGKPRYAVGVISGAAIQPSGDGQKAGPAAYVYDRARCFKIVYEYRGRQALAQAERKAAQLERWMSGEPPQPIPAGSKYRHGTYSAYSNLRCRCHACAEYTRRTNREWARRKRASERGES
jgi:hypothetical protein